jgi:glutaredoxin
MKMKHRKLPRFLLRSYALLLAWSLLVPGCRDKGSSSESAGKSAATAEEFATLNITDEADQFLFSYLLADGSFATVEKASDVPAEARGQVIVIDKSLSPQRRQSDKILYIANLTSKRTDGSYPYSIVSRFRFERDLLREPAKKSAVLPDECKDLAPSPPDRVILYSASWCSVCKAAAAFMTREGIPFIEKDIEQQPGAQQELTCKAMKTGTSINGVPVLDVAGKLLVGFDRDQLVSHAQKLKRPAPTGPATGPGAGATQSL